MVKILIRFYQLFISSVLGKSCRFYPSCSDYCLESYEKLGLKRALMLTLKRIAKCHPWHPGGVDLPPDR